MKYYITIDGGTTNTRVHLVEDGRVTQSKKISLGARDCMGGSDALKDAITKEIDNITLQKGIKPDDISAIIASGMITCEYGLCPLTHLVAPVGIEELHNGIHRVEGMFGALECYFIPGVKTAPTDPMSADMMRGEEAEIVGLASEGEGDTVYILPGSHTKHILLDKSGKISEIKTLLTGEMIAALAENTILKGSVRLDLSDFDRESILSGYDTARERGLNTALFKVRILKNLFSKSELECYSFFLGAIMSAEIVELEKTGVSRAVIGGKAQLRESLAHIIRERTDMQVITVEDARTECATAIGAVKIFEYTKG